MQYAMQKEKIWSEFRAGVVACVPTLLGYWAIGFACGAIGRINGFAAVEIIALAVFVYAGSAHFLFYQLAAAGNNLLAIALAVAFINMRYLLMGAYMAQFFASFTLGRKIVSALLITDETFGVAANHARRHNGQIPFYWLLGLNLLAWGNWIFANIVGAIFASALPQWLNNSLSFSLVGMFLGLLVLTFYASHTKMVDLIVMVLAILTVLFNHHLFDNNMVTILATLIAAAGGTIALGKIQRHRAKGGVNIE